MEDNPPDQQVAGGQTPGVHERSIRIGNGQDDVGMARLGRTPAEQIFAFEFTYHPFTQGQLLGLEDPKLILGDNVRTITMFSDFERVPEIG
jgi:hypothetical protein